MPAIRDRSAVRSSVIASAKYCCSRSSLRKINGRTTMDRRGAAQVATADGAGIDCDKQRRQGCAMTKAKHRVLCPRRRNPSIPLPRHPSRLGLFAMDAQKPDNGARCPASREKNFFPECELPHTSRPIPERCCLRERIGTLIWRTPVRKSSELPQSQPNRRTASSFRAEGFSAAPPSILQATPRGKNGRQNASARSR